MPLAARVTDLHTCPASTGPLPHVGGPILPPCSPNVQTNSLPQARATDQAMCVGPVDFIVVGSSSVTVNDLMAARLGDPTMHGGVIAMSSFNVEIGGPPAGVTLGNPAAGEIACQAAAKTRFIQIANYPTAPDNWRAQSWGNCGVEASRQIINTVNRSNISQETLVIQAITSGLALSSEKREEFGGVPLGIDKHIFSADKPTEDTNSNLTALLKQNGVAATEVPATSQNLTQAVAEHRGVIVILMAGTLWGPGHGPNPGEGVHAVLVTGVQYDAAGKMENVIINDSGMGQCSQPVGIVRFMRAINDFYGGGNHVVTDKAIW